MPGSLIHRPLEELIQLRHLVEMTVQSAYRPIMVKDGAQFLCIPLAEVQRLASAVGIEITSPLD